MLHVYFGILLILCCLAGYYFSWKSINNNKENLSIGLLLICGLALRIYCASDPYLHTWDERFHALVAKHLLHSFLKPTLYNTPVLPYSYQNWTANHIWLHKQPLTLWLIALSLKIFGIKAYAVRIPSIIMSTLSIKLVFDIGKYFYDKKVAFIAAFLFSINGFIIELCAGRTATGHVDITFLFFILLAIWCIVQYMRKATVSYVFLTGFFLGCAILTKWLTAFFILPLWVILMLFERREDIYRTAINLFILLITATLVFLPWQLFIIHTYPVEAKWEYAYNTMHWYQTVEGHTGSAFYYFDYLQMQYGELVYIPVCWFAYYTIAISKKAKDIVILLWFCIPYLFFSFAKTKMPAYVLIASPAIFLMTAKAFTYWTKENIFSNKLRWLQVVMAYCFILLPVRYTIERIKPFSAEEAISWEKRIKNFSRIHGNNPNIVLFNDEHYIGTMFYTNYISYPQRPDIATIKQLSSQGYKIFVLK